MAVWLLKGCDVLTYIVDGHLDEALRCEHAWELHPYTYSNQAHITVATAKIAYNKAVRALA